MKVLPKDNSGIALVMVVMLMAIILSVTSAGLLFSGLNLKTTSSFKMGTTSLHVADAGIQHALATIPSGSVYTFSTDPNSPTAVVPSTNLGTNYSYTVTAINDPASPGGNTQAILTSTALGPNSSRRVVRAYIGRGTLGLGATSLPGSLANTTETNFSGTSFSINGNDRCGVAPAVPGIAVTDPALATEITNNTTSDGGLASNQMGNVTGAGGTPSVATMSSLPMSVDDLANAYLNLSHTELAGGNYSGGTWGTSAAPSITRITGDAKIQGTVEGYGVLIVDGILDIAGNFEFQGLVIARGDIQVQITGNAGIYGSLMVGESTEADAGYELDVRGNATIQYDNCVLAAANGWVPLPAVATLVAWQELLS